MAINDQLNDEILVSVIAGDFEDEIDFSQPSDFTPPSRDTVDSVVPTPIVDSDEGEQGDEINKTSILPEFLKDWCKNYAFISDTFN